MLEGYASRSRFAQQIEFLFRGSHQVLYSSPVVAAVFLGIGFGSTIFSLQSDHDWGKINSWAEKSGKLRKLSTSLPFFWLKGFPG
jgi:hypothetical protein